MDIKLELLPGEFELCRGATEAEGGTRPGWVLSGT